MKDIPFCSKGLFSIIPICSNSFSLKKHGDDNTISCVSYLIFTNDLIILLLLSFMIMTIIITLIFSLSIIFYNVNKF